jgi:hypothetical protein
MQSRLVFLATILAAQQQTLQLWPNGNPEPSRVVGPEIDPTTDANRMTSGKITVRVTNVRHPSMTVYLPDKARNTGGAALVFPGDGYSHLTYNLECTEVCTWLNTVGVRADPELRKHRVFEHHRRFSSSEVALAFVDSRLR